MSEDLRLGYDSSVRLRAAELFAAGRGYKATATQLGLIPETVRRRHRTHVTLGVEGPLVMGKKTKGYRWELKAAARAVVEGGSDALRPKPGEGRKAPPPRPGRRRASRSSNGAS